MSVRRIAVHLGVAVSSVSVWTRDIGPAPAPPKPPKPLGRPRSDPEPIPGDPTKLCGSCDRFLPLTAFNRAGDGHQHWCRDCFVDYFRERGDRHREQSRAARRRRIQEGRDLVREHLASHPCTDCGEDDILVLEFDHHRGEKEANIGQLLAQGAAISRVAREIDRCQVVCVNCHRRRTASRAGYYRATGVPPAGWTAPARRNAEAVLAALRASGCVDCGERDPVVLDFDHLGDKRGSVPRLAGFGHSLASVEAEIAKCEIRCANCHRIRTLTAAGCWRVDDHWAAGLYSNPEN